MHRSSLIGLCLAGLLTGCGWFDGGPSPMQREPLRAGADRQVPATSALPPGAAERPYDAPAVPSDETRDARVGASVSGKGGQKAQKAEEEKERAARAAEPVRPAEPADAVPAPGGVAPAATAPAPAPQ